MSKVDELAGRWRASGWDAAYALEFLTTSIEEGTRLAARERMAVAVLLVELRKRTEKETPRT